MYIVVTHSWSIIHSQLFHLTLVTFTIIKSYHKLHPLDVRA